MMPAGSMGASAAVAAEVPPATASFSGGTAGGLPARTGSAFSSAPGQLNRPVSAEQAPPSLKPGAGQAGSATTTPRFLARLASSLHMSSPRVAPTMPTATGMLVADEDAKLAAGGTPPGSPGQQGTAKAADAGAGEQQAAVAAATGTAAVPGGASVEADGIVQVWGCRGVCVCLSVSTHGAPAVASSCPKHTPPAGVQAQAAREEPRAHQRLRK